MENHDRNPRKRTEPLVALATIPQPADSPDSHRTGCVVHYWHGTILIRMGPLEAAIYIGCILILASLVASLG